ncbi:GAF domain-containing protein [Candidatus Sumerlaeota bacterium]|nr:GAF domain-containing protein [Candidatus Sumerlaeota bacterium]
MLSFLTRTIYRKIFLLILLVSIVPATVGILQTYLETRVAMDSIIGNYLEERVVKVTSDIERGPDEKIRALLRLKRSHSLVNAIDTLIDRPSIDRGEIRKLLTRSLSGTSLQKDVLIIFDVSGEMLTASTDDISVSFTNQPWWKTILSMDNSQVFIVDVMLNRTSTAPEGERNQLEPEPYLFALSPYYEFRTRAPYPKVVVGLACAIKEVIKPATQIVTEGGTSEILLYSLGGRILYPREGYRIQVDEIRRRLHGKVGVSGWFGCSTKRGKQIYAYSQLKLLGAKVQGRNMLHQWYTLMGMDISDIQVFTALAFWRTSIISFGLVVIFCFLGLYLSRRMVMPLKKLNRSVQRITAGDMSSRVEVKSKDEIGVLARNFNIMTEKLEQTYKELAEKINELDKKAKQIALINEITQAINSELDLEETFRIIASELKKLVDYDRISVCFIEQDSNRAVFAYVEPSERELLPKGTHIGIENSNIGIAIRTGEIVIRDDISQSQEREEEPLLANIGMRSLIVVPLKSKNKIIGTLNLASKEPDKYGESAKELLMQVSEALAIGIEHSRMYTRISRFAEELEEKVKERTAELERAQMKLIQTEKFAATGKLAANIAHEINNPLQIVKNYLLVISRQVEKAQHQGATSPITTEDLKILDEELERIARIVRSLLDFYRKPPEKVTAININDEITSLIRLMEKGFERHHIKAELNLGQDVPAIKSSPDLIRQVLLNILRNAEDAMEHGGTLTVTTMLKTYTEDGRERKRIVVTIQDTGEGIPPEYMDKIFDPFFTSKKAEKGGTGLGLSVSYGIMQTLGGDIEVSSKVGVGTTVRLEFPVEELATTPDTTLLG